MSNKQNHPYQFDSKRPQYRTQGPKPRQRYPLKDLDDDFNSIQLPPPIKSNYKNNSKASLYISQSSNQKQFFNFNKSQLALSIKQKFKALHISSIHGLIGTAREKKSQIQDLLNKQQQKAFSQEFDQSQISASLRKLKKVVRLMEIVCKIILGKNQQNNYIDLSSQQEIIIQDMHSINMQNFQRQLQFKEREIQRLNKLVNILSIPKESKFKSSNKSNSKDSFTVNNSSINSGVKIQVQFQVQQPINKKNFVDDWVQTENQVKEDKQIAIQTQQQQKIDSSVQSQLQQKFISNIVSSLTQTQLQISASVQILQSYQIKRSHQFQIIQQYSIWNILDANQQNSQADSNIIKQNNEIKQKQNKNSPQTTLIQQIQVERITNIIKYYQSALVQTQIQQPISLKQNQIQTEQRSNKMVKSNRHQIQIQSKSLFMKRFKSIVKLAINSLNLSNNVLLLKGLSQQNSKKIQEQIQKISQYFNQEYHRLAGKYNDNFCKQIKDKIDIIYEKIFNIYQDNKKSSLFFQQIQ